MNKLFFNLLGFAVLTILLSCEKELHKYEGKPAVYFNEAGRLPAFGGEVLRDSTIMSFSLAKAQDSIVSMVVATVGAKKDVDRPYKLVINSSSDAIAGNHYQILNPTFVIKKNQLGDTVKIKFFRKTDMQAKTFLLSFDLQENENFSPEMKYRVLTSSNKKISLINYRWFVNDIIKRPGRWLDGYLGVFTRKKLLLIAETLSIEPAYLDASVSIAEMTAYGKFMQRYLNEQRAAGNTIYEEDGSEMVMGASVQ
ncbi:DUF4843 domain-containing protein [Pedobacter sp. SL55]|uniref:DUF4843 domain-containing protein n=1 Tax=Pedobacter sp. SL55 TaxID=2995161 RepID=UPI002271C8F3|nr:DUF4843 domain-containing protein [Pedobacter sp. SL55]WAC40816.1 DUF4843 domain-containing protein [Pedobacter sp. SL55]